MKQPLKSFIIAIAVLVLARLAIMAIVPVFDPSEGRYASICANMAESGDFLVPRFIHKGVFQSFDGKPPLLFQMGGIFCRLFGRNEFAVRLPSFLSAIGLLGIVAFAVRRMRDAHAARTAVIICATSVAFYATAGFCMTDLMLTFCVGGALLLECAFRTTPNGKWISRAIFALLGLGMLVKGPVALVLFGLPVLIDALVNRRMKILMRHDWIGGMLIFLAISAPWYILMERKTPGFLKYFFINENLLRFLVHDYGDKYGAGRETFRGMAAIWAIVVTLPWTPIIFLSGGRLNLRGQEPETLLTWGIVAITGFWCLTSRVPLAYLLPIVPLFAAQLSMMEMPRWTVRLVPTTVVCCIAILSGTIACTSLFTYKMPGWMFRAIRASDPKCGVSFIRKHPPYSAEFYFGSQLHLSPQPGDRLFMREKRRWKEVSK